MKGRTLKFLSGGVRREFHPLQFLFLLSGTESGDQTGKKGEGPECRGRYRWAETMIKRCVHRNERESKSSAAQGRGERSATKCASS